MEHGVSQTEGLLYQAPQLGSKLMDDRGRVRWLLGQRHRYIEGVMWTSWHAIRNSLAQLFSPMSNVLPTHWSIAMFSLPLHRGKYSEGDFVYSRTMGPQDLSSGVWKFIPLALWVLRALIAIGNACFHNTSSLSRGAVRAEPAILNPSQKQNPWRCMLMGNTITCLTYLKPCGARAEHDSPIWPLMGG